MELRVLGPVELWIAGKSRYLARRQQRLIVGILALEANRVVSGSRLENYLWGSLPPKQARAVIQTRISELRAVLHGARREDLGGGGIVTEDNGYILRIRPELVDVHQFRQLLKEARWAGSDEDAAKLLRDALDLWRGQVLGGWLPEHARATLTEGLESARLTAAEDLFEIELRRGDHRAVVDEIVALSAANPARERLTAQLMIALHRAGRSTEAVQAYERYRRRLADDLGLDPGEELQQVHVAILRGDLEDAANDSITATARPPDPLPSQHTERDALIDEGPGSFIASVPRLLPADIPDFTGRDNEAAQLREMLMTSRGEGVSVASISGPGGVGKTALSVHVAHLLKGDFPDGQMFASLRGVDDQPASPLDVLGRFLRALGVDGQVLPESLEDRIDLYRGLLAGRRVLVVLDNARGADQVMPLIPGSSTCAVLVNSRTRLGAAVSATALGLDVLDERQAIELLGQICGPGRIDRESKAAGELVRLCGRLPLAIRVAAAKLVAKPHWSVDTLIERLRNERKRLDHLRFEHLDVRSSIALSYALLPEEAQRLFRRLGDLGLTEVNVWASAALIDRTPAEAEEILEQLYDAQLVDIHGREATGHARYRLHDLVRLVARRLADSDEPADEAAAARMRALGAWLYVMEAVHRRVYGGDYMVVRSDVPRWNVEQPFLDALIVNPLQWFDTERHATVELIQRAGRDIQSKVCWALVSVTSPLFEGRYYYDDWTEILEVAHRAVQEIDDELGRAVVLHRMGWLSADRLDYETAKERYQRAARLYNRAGEANGRALAVGHLAVIERLLGNHQAALRLSEQALPGLRGDHAGESLVLRNMGQAHMAVGEPDAAETRLAEALEVARTRGSSRSEAQALFWQGMLRLRQGRYEEARPLFTEVLTLSQSVGDLAGEAHALRGLGLCHAGMGNRRPAKDAMLAALRLVRQPRPTAAEAQILDDFVRLFGPSAGSQTA